MRLKLWRLLAITGFFVLLKGNSEAQNCVPTNINGTTINLLCNQVCSTLVFQIPHLKSSSDYVLKSIPYNPFTYVTATGTQDLLLYCDDIYSNKFTLPFSFCFFDSLFSKVVIGSNGVITFDTTNSSCDNAWPINNTIPSNGGGGSQCSSGANYYPRSAIMIAYSDFDPRPKDASSSCPDATASLTDRKIEWRVEGNAPCRKFIVSYFHIGTFGNANTSAMNTLQIVLYESTGIIEYYFQNKTTNSSTNGGRAIMGIQNWLRDKAVFHPQRNNTVWPAPGAVNEGWRFIPSVGGSRYVSSELLNMSGTVLSAADTSTSTTGLLDLSFPNFCPPAGNNQFVVRTIFSACDNPSTQLYSLDTITISRTNGLNAAAVTTNTACGSPNGSINVTVPAGVGTAPYTFTLDGVAPVTGLSPHLFSGVTAGPHTVVITDASGGCTSTLNVTVNTTNGITANTATTATACTGINNGTITVTPTSGAAPYTYSLDGGTPIAGSAPYTFTNLPSGFHTIVVKDVSNCTSNVLNVSIPVGPALNANASGSATSCSGASNGSITVTPATGTAPFTYTLDGGTPVAGTASYTFTNLATGPHTVTVRDVFGCTTSPISVTIFAGPAITTTSNKTDALCNGSATGSITVVQPAIGTPPFQYSLNGTTWQNSPTFNGLVAGTYTVYYRESNGCQGSHSVTIAEPTSLAASVANVPVVCNGQSNGIITVSSNGGVSPYQYSINGGTTWQANNIFNVAAGTYTVSVKDANNCITTQPVTVTQPAALTAFSANTNASCDGGNDGTIIVNAAGGNAGYSYSIDGTTFQAANTFNVAPGNFTITVKDNLGCTTTFPTTVGLTNNLTFTPQTDPVICESKSAQLQLTSNAASYSWTPATALSSTTISNPVANPVVTTQYIVTAVLGRCNFNDTVIVKVNAAPIPDAGADGFICYGQTYQLKGNGGTVYTWTPSTYLSNANISNPVSSAEKTITYTLSQVIDANGCSSLTTDEMVLDVTPPIRVNVFPYDTIGYPRDTFQLLAVSPTRLINGNAPLSDTYTWTPSTRLDNPNIPNPIVTVGDIGDDIVYKVTIATIAGCKGDNYIRIRVYKGPDIYVPSAFTPNNDGKNDKFYPFPVGIKRINYFRVYNRNGQLVFSTNKLYEGWDGKIGGKEQATGVFVWMAQGVDKNDKLITKKGTVTLIR